MRVGFGPRGQAIESPVAPRLRAELRTRLELRRSEIEQGTLTRIVAISDPAEVSEPGYAEGLRAALSASLDYGLAGIEAGERRAPQVPAVLFTQARLAARNGVSVDTVLRRYFAGYAIFGDFLLEEAGEDLLSPSELKRVLRSQAALFDRLLAAVSEEHRREGSARPESSERRLADHVRGLLAGELLDTAELAYDFDAFHLGAVATGPDAPEVLRSLAGRLDCRVLVVRPDESMVWAWLGDRRRPVDPLEVASLASGQWPAHTMLALGEPGEGLGGWRFTHRQAASALPIALRGPQRIVHYGEVALLASALRDELLSTSLRQVYLAPLEAEADGGKVSRETLRAYFAADRNVSSAAAALGVSRRTVTNRLRAIEERLGLGLDTAGAELETALRLDQLGSAPLSPGAN